MRRRSSLLLAIALFLGACSSRDTSAGTPGSDRPAPSAVDSVALTLVDRSRGTPAHNHVPAAPTRTLQTIVWYPRLDQPAPLVVFAHGLGASGDMFSPMLRELASAGYVVAAPTFPLSSELAPGGPTLFDVVNQPGDLRFVIDQVIRLNDDAASPLHRRVEANRIAVAGHSLGGFTAMGVSFNTCCHDQRVKAVVVASGGELPFPGGAFTAGAGVPVLFVHGDADDIVPYQWGRTAYERRSAPKLFLTLLGGGHTPLDEPAQRHALVGTVVEFLDAELKGQPRQLEAAIRAGGERGVTRLEAVGRT